MNETLSLSNEEARALIQIPVDEVVSGRDIPDISDSLQDAISRVRYAFRETTDKWDFSRFVETHGIHVNLPVSVHLEKWLHSFPRKQVAQEQKTKIHWEPKTDVIEITGVTLGETIPGFDHFGILTGSSLELRYSENEYGVASPLARYCLFLKFNNSSRSDCPLQKGRMFFHEEIPSDYIAGSIRFGRFLRRESKTFHQQCRKEFTTEESAICLYSIGTTGWQEDIRYILEQKVLPLWSAHGSTPVRDGGQKQNN